MQEDVLGITQITDLSKADMARVRALALIELSALFDTNSISYSQRKPKRRVKGELTVFQGDQRQFP